MTTETLWHALDVERVFDELGSGPDGLTPDEAARRLEEYGPNTIQAEERVSAWKILLDQIRNPLVLVLVVAAIIAFLVGETADAIAILVVVVINSTIGFIQEYRAEEAIEALKERAAPEAEVLRCAHVDHCEELRIASEEVVPGDVIVLETGDQVPADARLFHASNLEVDESMLTGESTAVAKDTAPVAADTPVAERTNTVYGGTAVTQGRARAVVVGTGSQTEIGGIATMIQEAEAVESPPHQQVARLSRLVGIVAVLVSALALTLGLLRGFPFAEIALFAMAAAVSSIPAGLPAVMTITLAVGVNRMARRNAIIRRLEAVDTLGAATTIGTDKTGTLTRNEMTVQHIYAGGQDVEVTGVGLEPQGEFRVDRRPIDPRSDAPLELALRIGALCNDSRLAHHEAEGDGTVVYAKGTPEVILSMSGQVLRDGEAEDLADAHRDEILRTNERMADEALRVLALAYRRIGRDPIDDMKERLEYGEADLVFVGLVGMIDPPRPEARDAVALCNRAGIRVMMLTSDHRLTGRGIAREVGILRSDDGEVLTGRDLEGIADGELETVVQRVSTFARVSPGDKLRIVEALRRGGEVVAMTGDGVNDAPALKTAEIGMAMGITGTDVTKGAAEMILTDDNFASIVAAV